MVRFALLVTPDFSQGRKHINNLWALAQSPKLKAPYLYEAFHF